MLGLAILSLVNLNSNNLTAILVFWSIAGAIGVGFGEEMTNRRTLLVGLRTKFTEGKVWFFFSTLALAVLHLPNMFFGAAVLPTISQFVFTFIVGSLLYSVRRISGTLLLAMLLHGLWDSSVFLPGATGADPLAVQAVIYPIAIICAVAVILKNKGKVVQEY